MLAAIPEERFQTWLLRIVIDAETGCWLWQGAKYPTGYGRVRVNRKTAPLHRLVYERYSGASLQEGMQLHHLCYRPECLYPAHLVQLTRAAHSRIHWLERMDRVHAMGPRAAAAKRLARTHCKNGHEWTQENTYTQTGGGRGCRACHKDYAQKYHLLRERGDTKP